jgi:hypothetical protein
MLNKRTRIFNTSITQVRFGHDTQPVPSLSYSHNQFFKIHINIILSSSEIPDSVVNTATGYGLDDRGVGVQAPVGSRIFSSPRLPDRLWGPPSLLSSGY